MNPWLEVDPTKLSDQGLADRMSEVSALRARLDAAEMATIREWDARMVWAADGARSGGAWLKGHHGIAGSTAREKVRVARALGRMPLTQAAFEAGEVSYGKVRILMKGLTNQRTRSQFGIDEQILVEHARRFGTDELERIIAHWLSCADPNGADQEATERWNRRGASMGDINGTGHMKATFDPESFEVFRSELDRLMYAASKADRRDATVTQPRTAQQRRLDSLVEMARRSAECDISSASRSRPEIVVMVDYDKYLRGKGTSETSGGGRVSGEAVRRMACEAGIVRAVVAGRSEVLDLGRSTPVPNAAQRRSAALKWSECIWPGCDVPQSWCELHHLVPYRRGRPTGGATDNSDLAPTCSRHHHLVHEEGFIAARNVESDAIEIRRPYGPIIATVEPTGPVTRREVLSRAS